MTLPHDVARCRGVMAHGICPKREGCQRYLDRLTGGEWTPHYVCMCQHEVDAPFRHFFPVEQSE